MYKNARRDLLRSKFDTEVMKYRLELSIGKTKVEQQLFK